MNPDGRGWRNASRMNFRDLILYQAYDTNNTPYHRNTIAAKTLFSNLTHQKELFKPKQVSGCLFHLSTHPEHADMLVAARANSVQVWNPFTGECKLDLQCHKEVITTIEWLNGPEVSFYTSSLDKTIKLWKDYENVQTMTDHHDWIRSVAVSNNNARMLSGCVSAEICGWDVETGTLQFRIPHAHKHEAFPELNTINSLKFQNGSEDVFASGARDGTVKIWDRREGFSTCVQKIVAHAKKLNTAVFTEDNMRLMTAGRDNAIRIWDVRQLASSSFATNNHHHHHLNRHEFWSHRGAASHVLQTFNTHKCEGYNVSTVLANHDKQIVTGSEDRKVYIYDVESGNVLNVLDGHSSTVHLIDVRSDFTIATSSIDNCVIHLWSPNMNKKNEKPLTHGGPHCASNTNSEAVEAVLQKYGDQILHLFHKYNFSLSYDNDSFDDNCEYEQNSDLYDVVQQMARDFMSLAGDTTNNNNNNGTTTVPRDDNHDEDNM